jgi:hypothetical protein
VCWHIGGDMMGSALHLKKTVRCLQGAVHQRRVGKNQRRAAAVFQSLSVKHLEHLQPLSWNQAVIY